MPIETPKRPVTGSKFSLPGIGRAEILVFSAMAVLVSFVGTVEGALSIPFFYLTFLAVCILVPFAEVPRSLNCGRLRRMVFYGFQLNILFTTGAYYYFIIRLGVPFEVTPGDGLWYHRIAEATAHAWLQWKGANFQAFGRVDMPGFHVVGGIVYYIGDLLGGHHHLNVRYLNCLLAALLPLYVFLTANRIYPSKIARRAALVALVYPNFLHFASLHLRDIWITFLFLYSGYSCISYYCTKRSRFLAGTALAILVLNEFRSHYAVLLVGIAFVTFLFTYLERRQLGRMFLLGIVMVIPAFFLIKNTALFRILMGMGGYDLSAYLEHSYSKIAEKIVSASGNSLGAEFLAGSSQSMVRRVCLQPLIEILQPYPFWNKLRAGVPTVHFQQFLAGVAWHLLLPIFLLGLVQAVRKETMRTFFLYSSVIVVIFMVGMSFPSVRFRLPIVPFAIILSCATLTEYAKRTWFPIYYLGFHLILFLAYHFLKYREVMITIAGLWTWVVMIGILAFAAWLVVTKYSLRIRNMLHRIPLLSSI